MKTSRQSKLAVNQQWFQIYRAGVGTRHKITQRSGKGITKRDAADKSQRQAESKTRLMTEKQQEKRVMEKKIVVVVKLGQH